jgi:hypothetical protein
MAQHASLAPERWARFSLDQQILMIANEMNRAAKLIEPLDAERLRRGYERTPTSLSASTQGRGCGGSCSAGGT